jgi:hypothetical protein
MKNKRGGNMPEQKKTISKKSGKKRGYGWAPEVKYDG